MFDKEDCNRYIGCVDHHGDFHISWTGWKAVQNSTILAGQFLAVSYSGKEPSYRQETAQINLEEVHKSGIGFPKAISCDCCGRELNSIEHRIDKSAMSTKIKADTLERLKSEIDNLN